MSDSTERTSPKDVFLHLLAVTTLYVSAVSLVTLFFQYINYWFPDALSPFRASDAMRSAIASLLIIFPAHVITVRLLHKDQIQNPEKRESRLRKWLLYLTLFLAAIALIGDLVALVYNFLQGELSLRFYVKILAVGIVAGGVFLYYLWELRRISSEITPRAKNLLWAAVLLVIFSVIGSFFIIGSPFTQRMVQFDQRRVGDLQSIQWQVVNYWQRKNALPASLADLKDDLSGFVMPIDPETGAPYEYQKTGDLSFELCATFDLEANDPSGKGSLGAPYVDYFGPDWAHGQGRQCFTRTIDPDLYGTDPKRP